MVPITVTNPADFSNYTWSIQEGNASLSCTNCPDPVVTVNTTDIINIIVTASTSNTNFCGAQGFIQLRPGEEAQVVGPSFQACLGESVQVSTGDPSLTNVVWDVISGDLTIVGNPANPMPTVVVNGGGLLRFFAESTDPDVCRVVGTVAVSPFPQDESNILLEPDPNATDIGQGSEVMAMLNVNEAPPTGIMWMVNGEMVEGNTTTITFDAEDEVNFVEVKFTNSKGCVQVDTISFPTVPPSWQIPNAFTPDNGDDINDRFRVIINGNITLQSFVIYNRWGQKVYEAQNGDLSGWDGRHADGQPASSDTYVYKGTLRFPDGRTELIKGDVILIK
jgi:gliding motility-associated-like protein